MTTVVISQPMYFPWAGFLDLISRADVLIWLDDVQFSKGSFTNRVQVKLLSGPHWLTVPLEGKGIGMNIGELKATDVNWIGAHQNSLSQSFKGAPHKGFALDVFAHAASAGQHLCDRLIASAEEMLAAFRFPTVQCLRSSQMRVPGRSWQRVLDLVREVGGTRYVSAAGGAKYIHHQAFDDVGVDVQYMDYDLASWPQAFGDFTPYVTGLDLLAWRGVEGKDNLRSQLVPWAAYLKARGLSPQ